MAHTKLHNSDVRAMLTVLKLNMQIKFPMDGMIYPDVKRGKMVVTQAGHAIEYALDFDELSDVLLKFGYDVT